MSESTSATGTAASASGLEEGCLLQVARWRTRAERGLSAERKLIAERALLATCGMTLAPGLDPLLAVSRAAEPPGWLAEFDVDDRVAVPYFSDGSFEVHQEQNRCRRRSMRRTELSPTAADMGILRVPISRRTSSTVSPSAGQLLVVG